MRLIAEALGLCCQVLALVDWNATLVDIIAGVRNNGLDDSNLQIVFQSEPIFLEKKSSVLSVFAFRFRP